MKTIALIGADGSGKTTIAKKILENPPAKLKYIYMGLNIESSNYALPTSRLIHFIKVYNYKKRNNIKEKIKNISLHSVNRGPDKRGKIGVTFRTINRISEQIYRQIIVLYFQALGYHILFDRHFLFDGAIGNSSSKNHRVSSRIYSWLLFHVLPKPNLTLFLYAPPEVLHQRKIETSLAYLYNNNKSFEYIGSKTKNFIKIDATKSLPEVVEEVRLKINNFIKG